MSFDCHQRIVDSSRRQTRRACYPMWTPAGAQIHMATHLLLHRWKRRHRSAWGILPSDLAARHARLLASDASAMIHNRLDADSTFSQTLPHQRDAFRPDLPRRARHSQERKVTAKMSIVPSQEHAGLNQHLTGFVSGNTKRAYNAGSSEKNWLQLRVRHQRMSPSYCCDGFMTTCMSWDLREVPGDAHEITIPLR